jgi:tyrosyl-tRNA synthetase
MAPSLEEKKALIAQKLQNANEETIDVVLDLLAPFSLQANPTAITTKLSVKQQKALIEDNLQEVLNPEIIDAILAEGRPLKIYWGTATTGAPHCGYFPAMAKLGQFLQAGCEITVLLADIHGFLDNLKAPIELVAYRAEYYRLLLVSLLGALKVPVERLKFVLGSSYQPTREYYMDLMKMSTQVTEHDARRAGADVVKQTDNAPLSSLIYPLMQCLDEQHLGVDAQFGGVDQRKIFVLATEKLPRLGFKTRAHLMNPMVPGLAGGKMSASDPNSKIDLLDGPEVVKKKLSKSFCPPQTVEGNGVLSFVEFVLVPTSELLTGSPKFVVERRDEEPLVYTDIKSIHEAYKADVLTPQLLKTAVTTALNALLAPVQADFNASPKFQALREQAYPPPVEVKKVKKVKNKGTGHPGAGKKVVAQPDGSVEGEGKQEVDLGDDTAKTLEALKLEGDAVRKTGS